MNPVNRVRHHRRKRRSPYLSGMASIFDFTGSLGPRYEAPDDIHKAASDVMARSWKSVGDAMWAAIGHHRPEAEAVASADAESPIGSVDIEPE